VVPPPTSTEQRAGLLDLLIVHAPRYGVRLGDNRDQLEIEHARHGLECPEMDQRRKRVEHADADMTAVEPDGVSDGVAVDRRAGHRGMDEPDVDIGQARLPRDGALGLAQCFFLDALDERVQLAGR